MIHLSDLHAQAHADREHWLEYACGWLPPDHTIHLKGGTPCTGGKRDTRSSCLDNGVPVPDGPSSLSAAGAGTPTYPEDR